MYRSTVKTYTNNNIRCADISTIEKKGQYRNASFKEESEI